MNKKIFMIIITSITILCIIAGTFYHFRYTMSGVVNVGKNISKAVRNGFKSGEDWDFDMDFDEDFDADSDDTILPSKHTFTNPLADFDSIAIKGNVMGISIKRGNRFEISGSYNKDPLKPSFGVSGGTLKVSQPGYKRKLVTNGNCKIEITVPFGTNLDTVDINVDVGAVSVEGVDLDQATINTDVGAIAFKNVEFRDLTANSDVGAISLELLHPVSEYTIEAKSDVGAIQVNNSNVKRRYSQTGSSNKRITIKTDVGGIEVK